MTEKEIFPEQLHGGHRKRMRARYRREGLEGFAPHEVLELLLFYGRARGDVNPLAHRLITQFGSLRGVLEAEYDQLLKVPGVGEETATLISLMIPMFRRYAATLTEEQRVIHNRTEALKYCVALQAGRRKENFFVICINNSYQVIGHYLISEGSLSEVQAYPRVVIETALNCNAEGVILCHNHPGGSVIPSKADIEATRVLESLLTEIDILLLDHIIVAGDLTYSMVGHGDIRQSPDAVESSRDASDADLLAEMIRKMGCTNI